ncbi:hypothetical protein M409DRAFT_67980 [Zasmidium cellare ATCC 36951]|uniref:G-patch domain-containing protein n=1 Tax=Zasmidium cellare ATCC 36951 TaxID=1080233 RepID=A0A6A6CGE6_ZASCE|nr:uncharacterized protein M409DRAFT_67980 [Zasmidium cellare ATCC 36951]KAF2164496.1 hypothetical protein M409DRAFT_67980 [Zasmidium cellare ATCC 36951]
MAGDEDEDDYLSMPLDHIKEERESSIKRVARLKQERLDRGHVKSKAERKKQAEEDREKALATAIDSSNKGAKMMSKMGYEGGALGKTEGARTQPIQLQMKEDRGGLGMENDKKRKIREAAEAANVNEKRVKLTLEEYRERNRLEREEKKQEAQLWTAMRTLETFETEDEPDAVKGQADGTAKKSKTTPLHSINVLWRSVVKERLGKDHKRRMNSKLAQSLSRRTDYNDVDCDEDDKVASGAEVEEDLDEEDAELDEFQALPVGERLQKVVAYLREHYFYCFWCMIRYPTKEMGDCPGLSEDEHG